MWAAGPTWGCLNSGALQFSLPLRNLVSVRNVLSGGIFGLIQWTRLGAEEETAVWCVG